MGESTETALPCSDKLTKGTVVPPLKLLEHRWAELDELVKNNNELRIAKDQFLAAASTSPPSYGGSAPIVIPYGESNGVDLDHTEHYSRVFRAANKLSSVFEIEGNQGEFASTGAQVVEVHARWGRVWSADVPGGSELASAVEAMKGKIVAADAEMCAQVSYPDVFMIWAAVPASSEAKNFSKTCLLIDILMLGLAFVSYEVKARAQVNRPWMVDRSIKPTLPGPEHSSWPAGHAFVGGAMATLLASLQMSPDANRLWAAAARIGHNRIRGGLHTAPDVQSGLELGSQAMHDLLIEAKRASKHPDGSKIGGRLARLWQLVCSAKDEWK